MKKKVKYAVPEESVAAVFSIAKWRAEFERKQCDEKRAFKKVVVSALASSFNGEKLWASDNWVIFTATSERQHLSSRWFKTRENAINAARNGVKLGARVFKYPEKCVMRTHDAQLLEYLFNRLEIDSACGYSPENEEWTDSWRSAHSWYGCPEYFYDILKSNHELTSKIKEKLDAAPICDSWIKLAEADEAASEWIAESERIAVHLLHMMDTENITKDKLSELSGILPDRLELMLHAKTRVTQEEKAKLFDALTNIEATQS